MKGMIADCKRFAVHDGPGIRTTLFLKGCPLHCRWCHNPENLSVNKTLAFTQKLCINCGDCLICPRGVHTIDGEHHILHMEKCISCGECVSACLPGALHMYGREETAVDTAAMLLEDAEFFAGSGGGVTLSGGEPLMQADFCFEVLSLLKETGIHTAVDTCGYARWERFQKLLPVTDIFLFDLKHMDTGKHKSWTGRENSCIIENLLKLDKLGFPVEIRIPIIPGFNDDSASLRAFGEFLQELSCVTCVRLLAYHGMEKSKYSEIAMPYTMPKTRPPDAGAMADIQKYLKNFFDRVVLSGDI